jgi:DNA topoisomerase-1
VVVPGFLAVYEEGKDSKSAEDDDEGRKLPLMKPGDTVPLDRIHADQHFTQPPPRFTEAALVKALEEYGIGRPSTYASIIQTLLFRKYVEMEGRAFKPTDVGRAVSNFLSRPFHPVRGLRLHRQAGGRAGCGVRGEEDWIPLMEKFWGPFKQLVDDKKNRWTAPKPPARANSAPTRRPASRSACAWAASGRMRRSAAPPTPTRSRSSPRCVPARACTRSRLEDALELFKLPRKLGQDKDEEVSVGVGRFGPFAKRGSVYASLKKEDDPYTIDLARAVFLIEEKEEIARNRIIKEWDGSEIQVLNGRFGPYLSDGKLNGKIPKDREPASLTWRKRSS